MNIDELLKKLVAVFPIKQYSKGTKLEELASNSGEQRVIQYIRTHFNTKVLL